MRERMPDLKRSLEAVHWPRNKPAWKEAAQDMGPRLEKYALLAAEFCPWADRVRIIFDEVLRSAPTQPCPPFTADLEGVHPFRSEAMGSITARTEGVEHQRTIACSCTSPPGSVQRAWVFTVQPLASLGGRAPPREGGHPKAAIDGRRRLSMVKCGGAPRAEDKLTHFCLIKRLDQEIAGRSVKAALFSSFTFKREFFEEEPLSPISSQGRLRGLFPVTAVVNRDQYHGSGWGYEVVRAPRGQLWHAKLVALMLDGNNSSGRCTVLVIGSGNLTRSGWEDDQELFHLTSWTGWRLPVALWEWLEQPWLRESEFAVWCRNRAVERIQKTKGARLLHSLDEPLWNQLEWTCGWNRWTEARVRPPLAPTLLRMADQVRAVLRGSSLRYSRGPLCQTQSSMFTCGVPSRTGSWQSGGEVSSIILRRKSVSRSTLFHRTTRAACCMQSCLPSVSGANGRS